MKLYDVILTRYSFVGDPTLPNRMGTEEFLFGSTHSFDPSDREDVKFMAELKEAQARFFLVHVKECDQILDNGCTKFLPKDVISWVEI